MTMHEIRSPTEFPRANIVIPMADGRMWVSDETNVNSEMISEAMIDIHAIDAATPIMEITHLKGVEGFDERTRLW